jgi:hypothetical protein
LTYRATAGDLALLEPEGMKSKDFSDLTHGQPLLRQPVFSTSSGAKQARRLSPAHFMKIALEFHSGVMPINIPGSPSF